MTCPCCGGYMQRPIDDAPFCWDCGLYAGEDPAECDAGHQLRERETNGT